MTWKRFSHYRSFLGWTIGAFPHKEPVMWSFDVSIVVSMACWTNNELSVLWGIMMLLWRHCNDLETYKTIRSIPYYYVADSFNDKSWHIFIHNHIYIHIILIVARLREPRDSNVGILENKPTLLTISRLWRYCGPSNYRFNFLLYWYAPWVFFLGRQCAFVFPIYVRKYRK